MSKSKKREPRKISDRNFEAEEMIKRRIGFVAASKPMRDRRQRRAKEKKNDWKDEYD
jgi:hypothetical protein